MGQMGPMMGGPWGAPASPDVVLPVVLLALVLGAVASTVLTMRGGLERQRLTSPEGILREKYASGDIGRQQYLDALEDILKDRYVRGELTLDEYEAKLGLLLSSPRLHPRRS